MTIRPSAFAIAGLAIAAALLLRPAAVRAGDDPSASPRAPAREGARGGMRLRLEDAIRLGMGRNLALTAGAYDPAIACQRVIVADASFDTLLTAGVAAGHAERFGNVEFGSPLVTVEDTIAGDVSLSRRLRDGARLSVVFHADRLSTNDVVTRTNPGVRAGASVEYARPLLRGAGNVALADVHRAQSDERAAEFGLAALLDRVLLEIETAYWNLAFAQEQASSKRTALELAKNLLDRTQVRVDAHDATPLDLADAKAGVAEREGDLAGAEGERGTAEDRLRLAILPFDDGRVEGQAPGGLLLAIDAVDDPRADVPGDDPGSGPLERFVAEALRRRPDLLAADAELQSRDVDVVVAEDGLRPQLDLVARLGSDGLDGGAGDALDRLLRGDATSGSIGLTFSMYLGRRASAANVRIAEWTRRQAGIRKRELESRVVAEVRESLRALATARAKRRAAAEGIRSAKEALDGERERQRLGDSTAFRVLEKESTWSDAVTREGRAAADIRIARAGLWKAIGMLAEVRHVAAPSLGR